MMRWSRTLGIILFIGWVSLTLAFFYFTMATALDKNVPWWAWVLLLAISVAALVAALGVSEDIAISRRRVRSLFRPKPIAGLYVASFSAFGVMATLLSQMEPRNATKEDTDELAANDATTHNMLAIIDQHTAPKPPPPPPRILAQIGGLWGRESCTIQFRFTVKDRSLKIIGVRQPAGTPPYAIRTTIILSDGDTIETRGETGKARGAAATFTLESYGPIKRLRWKDDMLSPDPTVLERCAEGEGTKA